MDLVVNPPTPWPNWQAPVSTRKTRPTIMERAVEGGSLGQRREHGGIYLVFMPGGRHGKLD